MSNSSQRPMSEVTYTEETRPTRLSEAEQYFGLGIPKAFLVSEGVYSPNKREGLAKGE